MNWKIEYSPASLTCTHISFSLEPRNFISPAGIVLQTKDCHITALVNILQNILDALDAHAQLYIDMRIECTAEELIVRHYPAIVNLDFIISAPSFHSQLGCESTIIGPSCSVQGVAFMVSLCMLNEFLGKPLSVLRILHARAARIHWSTWPMDHLLCNNGKEIWIFIWIWQL